MKKLMKSKRMKSSKLSSMVLWVIAGTSICFSAAAAFNVAVLVLENPSLFPGFLLGDGSFIKTFLWFFSGIGILSASVLYLAVCPFISFSKPCSDDHGSAHWASDREIAQSGLFAPRGIVVGAVKRFWKNQLLRYDGEGHVIVVSPTRSGKGVTVVVPTALTWEHSVIFNDIKGELWALSAGWRKKCLNSICLRFDATCSDNTAACWNPLLEIRRYPHDVRDAQNIALTLSTTNSPVSYSDNERHFRVMGTRLLKAVILHQLYSGREKTLPGCYRLLTNTKRDLQDTLMLMLHTEHDPARKLEWTDTETGELTTTHPVIAHVARDMLSKSDREQSAIISSTISYLEAFDDPVMAQNVSESHFTLFDLMHNERPVSLYLTTPVADLERVQSLHRLLFTLAGTRNTETLEFEDGKVMPRYKHPLLQVFDECAHLGYTPMLQKHFSLASGYGIYGLFVFQDFSQLFALYGKNESITSNCDIKVAFAPNNLETATYLSKLLGTETREKRSSAVFNHKSRGEKQSLGRALLTPDECLRLSKQKSIVLKNGYPPILGHKIPYYEVPELLSRSQIPPPDSDRLLFAKSDWVRELREVKLPVAKAIKKRRIEKKPAAKRRQGKKQNTSSAKPQQTEIFGFSKKDSKGDGK